MNDKIQINHPPKGGWRPNTVYLVKVQNSQNDPEHRALLHVGLMDHGEWGWHCEVWHNTYDEAVRVGDLYSIKFVKRLCRLEY